MTIFTKLLNMNVTFFSGTRNSLALKPFIHLRVVYYSHGKTDKLGLIRGGSGWRRYHGH